ncbi:site-specific DNA-methyltransferase [Rhizobium sp. CF122]|uniref:site-specific DNA-methyltransferase n=1 Tax=Rhizobium sp. CF122 TaxID=1144312 RepID=UPI00068B5A7E|nr:site-specific DNA-methyltransferase [Rhizobium sp. CF122]
MRSIQCALAIEPYPEKTSHPCQFPEELVDRLVKAYTAPGHTVLDPISGSGTVGASCNRLGRNSILIEQQLNYVEIARARLLPLGLRVASRMSLRKIRQNVFV